MADEIKHRTSINAPSRNEEEYFAKRNLESIEHQRSQIKAELAAAERKSHFMKCPRCGADLQLVEFHGVQIDRCPECNGIWVDQNEIDAVVAHDDQGVIGRVLRDVLDTFNPHRKGSK
jgi:uncharacterized C2H2 Zn-finger protein